MRVYCPDCDLIDEMTYEGKPSCPKCGSALVMPLIPAFSLARPEPEPEPSTGVRPTVAARAPGGDPLEADLLAAFLLYAPAAMPDWRIFRRNVGTLKVGKRVMRFGIAGQCDTYAIARGGRHIEIELKAASGRLSPDQKRWRDFCHRWNIPWALLQARPGETVGDAIPRWMSHLVTI